MITNKATATVLLASLMENEQTKPLLDKALSTYPLYKGKKDYDLIPTRESLNEKILNRYKYREIGFETVGRFLFELENTMKLIMPTYNELFKTVEIMSDIEDPFGNVDFTETFEEERTGTTETEGTSTGNSNTTSNTTATSNFESEGTTTNNITTNGNNTVDKTRKFSDTPQNNLDSLNKYLTDYTEESEKANLSNTEVANGGTTSTSIGTDTNETTSTGTDSTETTGKSEVTGTTKHTFTKKGNQGVNTYAHDMNEFRTTINDYVEQIVNDERLNELFLLVW